MNTEEQWAIYDALRAARVASLAKLNASNARHQRARRRRRVRRALPWVALLMVVIALGVLW